MRGATIHLLENVHQSVSATAIREAVAAKKPLRKFVDAPVEEYIKKEGLVFKSSVIGRQSSGRIHSFGAGAPAQNLSYNGLANDRRLKTDN